jgi:hypothetical protein
VLRRAESPHVVDQVILDIDGLREIERREHTLKGAEQGKRARRRTREAK